MAVRRRAEQSGFTLIELLTSIAILLILVGMLTVAFNTASNTWRAAEKDVERFQDARLALDLIARDLQQAFVSTNVPFYGSTNGLAFVAANVDDTKYLDLAETIYVLSNNAPPYTLYRRTSTWTNATTSVNWDFYYNLANANDWPTTFDRADVVCGNVVRFRLRFFDDANPPNEYTFWNSSDQANVWPQIFSGGLPKLAIMSNRPPAYIDVRLDVIDSKSARLLSTLTGTAAANVITQSLRSFAVFVKIPQR